MSGLLSVHISVMLLGFTGLFGKLINLSPVTIVFWRSLLAAITLVIILLLLKKLKFPLNKKDWIAFIVLSGILAVHWSTFFYSIQLSTVAIGVLSFSSFPIFVTLLEPIVFRYRLARTDVLIAIATFVGVGFIVPLRATEQLTLGMMWGVISGITYALVLVLSRSLLRNYSSMQITGIQYALAALLLLPFANLRIESYSSETFLYVLFLGVICTALAHTMLLGGMRFVRAQIASVIITLESLYGIILAWIILSETPTLRILVGGSIVLGCVTIASLRHRVGME